MRTRYFALYVDPDTNTKGFRFIRDQPEGDPEPKPQEGDILVIRETLLDRVVELIAEHQDNDDFFLFEIEGSDNLTSGRSQVVYLGKHTHKKELSAAAQQVLRFKTHWMVNVFNYREISEIFVKLQPRCGKLN